MKRPSAPLTRRRGRAPGLTSRGRLLDLAAGCQQNCDAEFDVPEKAARPGARVQ